MNLKKFPDSEKPRERLIKYGAENLSNTDLISILIGTGTKNCNVKELSSIILSKINSIESLDEFSKELINNRYNLDKTQSETAKSMNVTQVMVSRKEKEILQRLRTRLS